MGTIAPKLLRFSVNILLSARSDSVFSAMVPAQCFLTKFPWPFAAGVMGVLCFSGKPAEAARTLEVVRGIQYLTADSTLLPLVRQHDLVNAFGVGDEAAAVSRLRGMIDLAETAGPRGGLQVGVISGDSGLAGVLTNALAEAGSRMPVPEAGERNGQAADGTMTQAEIESRQDLVVERRNEVMRLMQEHGIKGDRPLAYEDGAGEVEEIFADAEIAAQWKESRERTRLFNQEMVKVVKQGEEERAAEEATRAAEEGRPLPEKSIAGADPSQFPDYLRARRAWEQQLAVLNHQMARQFEAEILKKRRAALSGTSGASVLTDHGAFHAPAQASRLSGKPGAGLAAGAGVPEVNMDSEKMGERGEGAFLPDGALAAGLILLAVLFAVALVLARGRRRGLGGRDADPGN
jgi:hypothetical protein